MNIEPSLPSPVNTSQPPLPPTLSVSGLEKFFIWLSGVSPKILATCPESEQKRQAALGGAVLIPAVFATITSAFLLHTLNFSTFVIVPVSLLWAMIVLLMDRALLSTYRKGFSFPGKVGQFLLRFTIAFLIALTVAHPVVLLLFSERIEAAYNEGRIKEEHARLALRCDIKNPASDIRLLDQRIDALSHKLENGGQYFEPSSCSAKIAGMSPQAQQELDNLRQKKAEAEEKVRQYNKKAGEEKQGVPGDGLSGKLGCGSKCLSWLGKSHEAMGDVTDLDKAINQMTVRQAEAKDAEVASSKKQCAQEREKSGLAREEQIRIDQASLKLANEERHALNTACLTKEAAIANLKPDILTQTEILSGLILSKDGISWHHLLVFLNFMLLFLAIDMLAVVLKMVRTGIYESKIDIDERDDERAYFYQKRHSAVMQFSAMATTEREHIDGIPDPLLREKLTTNLDKLVVTFTATDNEGRKAFFNSTESPAQAQERLKR